jgi:hypothetical protein
MRPAATHGKKRSREAIADISYKFAQSLIDSTLGNLVSPEDVRRILAEPPARPVLLSNDFLLLSLACEGIFSLEMLEDVHVEAMPQLVGLLQFAYDSTVTSGSEEVWASVADNCTGRVWRALSAVLGTFSFSDDRNRVDASGVTKTSLRPDYTAYSNRALVVKAEHKADPSELKNALDELVTKMTGGWNALAMRGAPFLPCYAVGGERLQFAVVIPPTCGAATQVVPVTEPFLLSTPQGRLRTIKAACNMFRIIVWLRSRMPEESVPLYVDQKRADGGTVTVFDDHVIKLTTTAASDAVYAALLQIPCATRVTDVQRSSFSVGLTRLRLQPVAVERKPRDESELRAAVQCVLRALEAFHARGFVHHDVRWPNVLSDGSTGWILSDFELAGAVGTVAPNFAVKYSSLPPEARLEGALYTTAADVWQVGHLIADAHIATLTAAGTAFSECLLSDDPLTRPTAAAALTLEWFQVGAVSGGSCQLMT